MASRALTARFMRTCSIWPGSAFTRAEVRRRAPIASAMSSPITRRSIFSMSATTCVQVEHLGLQHLAAAEGQQLAGQAGGALAGVADLVDAAAARGSSGGQLVEHHAAVAADDGQQVVEVVRHAAGQPADGFHLLRLAQLVFQLAALGHVHAQAAEEQGRAVGGHTGNR